MPAEPSDAELLSDRTPAAFGAFYMRYVAAVTAYVARRVREPEVVFDVVAETFARALEHRDQFDAARGPAVAWLFGIARHLLVDSARSGQVQAESRRRLGMGPIAIDDDQLALIEARGEIDLASTLTSLSAEQREAVFLRVLAEQPYPAIARQLGLSEQVVRKRVSRGLATLRRELRRSP
jgi:RNA polymerase sigma factor (sigma-70 family)